MKAEMKVKPHRPYTAEYDNGQSAPNLLVYLLWLLVHKLVTIVEQLMQSLRQPFFSKRIRIKAHQYAEHQQQQLPAPVSKLSKVPKHLVVLLGPEPPLYRQLAQFIFWSLAAEIEYVSFYDHNGKRGPSVLPARPSRKVTNWNSTLPFGRNHQAQLRGSEALRTRSTGGREGPHRLAGAQW